MKLIELHNFTSQLVTMTELQYNREQFLKASLLKQVIASKYQRYNYPPSKINEICNDGLDFVEEYISESKVIINKKPVLGAIFFNPDHITLLKRVIAEFITGKVVTELIIAHIKKSTDPSSTSALNMLPQKQLDEIAIPFLDKCLASAERKNLCLAGKPIHLRSTEELYQNTLKLRSINCTAFTLDQLTQYLFFSRIQEEISRLTLPLSGTGRTLINSLFFFAHNTKPTIEEIAQREMRWQIEQLLPLGH